MKTKHIKVKTMMNYNEIKITRTELTQNDRYLITKSRAAKILGLKENDIEFVYICPNGEVLVGLFNRSVKINIGEFKKSYATERKARSGGLKVTKRQDQPHSYSVRNEGKNTLYKVDCFTSHLQCNCPDYEIGTQVFNDNRVCCKHIYSVLDNFGFGSLVQYLKSQRTKPQEQIG